MKDVKVVDNASKDSGIAASSLGRRVIWREIASDLEQQIKARQLTFGDKLPTEYELSSRYMVNRHTVRRALAALAERGLVESTQGRGSYVRRPAIPFRIGRRVRFTEYMASIHATSATRTLGAETRPADLKVARALNIRVGEPVVTIERCGLVDDEPICLSRHQFSYDRFPFFIKMYEKNGSVTQTLRDSGVPDYVRLKTCVSARLPTPQEAELLRMPRHVPLLVTQSINLDGLRRPLEYGEARFAADRIELDIDSDQGDLGDAG